MSDKGPLCIICGEMYPNVHSVHASGLFRLADELMEHDCAQKHREVIATLRTIADALRTKHIRIFPDREPSDGSQITPPRTEMLAPETEPIPQSHGLIEGYARGCLAEHRSQVECLLALARAVDVMAIIHEREMAEMRGIKFAAPPWFDDALAEIARVTGLDGKPASA